jgi:hypothetical protein
MAASLPGYEVEMGGECSRSRAPHAGTWAQMTRSSLCFLLLTACAPHLTDAERQLQLDRSLHAIDPNAEPAPPKDAPADGRLEFNTEYWLGTQKDEAALITAFGTQIQDLQRAAKEKRKADTLQRGFHAKSHGCVQGELRLKADRPERTRFGVFAETFTTWPVVVRYSNGVGWAQADDELDARGMAVKLLGVPGQKYLPDETATQDFLMTNSPTPVGKDAVEFMDFARANADGRAAGIGFLLGHLRSGNALFRTGTIASTVNETYWSGGPLHLGAHQAAKLSATPCATMKKREPSREGPDYLAADLSAAAKDGFCFTLRAQFQKDPIAMPIEDSSVIWDETESVPVALGELVIPAQPLMPKEQCDALVFHPWHSIAAHRPMGNHNRARLVVYSASQALRPHGQEPAAPAK